MLFIGRTMNKETTEQKKERKGEREGEKSRAVHGVTHIVESHGHHRIDSL